MDFYGDDDYEKLGFEGEDLEDLEDMIKEGEARANCHSCHLCLESIYQKECEFCKCKINIDDVIIELIDWNMAN